MNTQRAFRRRLRSCVVVVSVSMLATVSGARGGSDEGGLASATASEHPGPVASEIERVTTRVPFPRGLAIQGDRIFTLARGRVRGAGGVSAEVQDLAGTIFEIDPSISEPIIPKEVSEHVRHNGTVIAEPTEPPFRLWDRSSVPPERDRWTDRPYCTLRYHDLTQSFYICGFSGIDKRRTEQDPVAFSKNLTDVLFRYDLRTRKWYEVERHDIEAGGNYPHHDPSVAPPPHGWLNGPDNCLTLGNWLYAVSKDNSLLVRYDLTNWISDPEAPSPAGEPVVDSHVPVAGEGILDLYGPSALGYWGGYLYVGYRTSSVILRIPLDSSYAPKDRWEAEIVARFEPYDPSTGESANLTDLCFDERGRLYVISAKPARVYRFQPDPNRVFDARDGAEAPWADMAALTQNPKMKSENVLVHDDWLYVTSGDGYDYQAGAAGTIYRVPIVE